MATNSMRPRKRRTQTAIMIVPKQTLKAIRQRNALREAIHDERAKVVERKTQK